MTRGIMLLIYEGPDGAGKDTLRKAFDRETNYVHTCVVRMFLSNIVYARYYHRKLPIGYLTMVRKFMHDYVPLIVLVIAEPKVLNARVMMRGENLASTPLPNKIIQFYSEAIGRSEE